MAHDYTNLILPRVSRAKVVTAARRLSMNAAVAGTGSAVVVFLPFDAYLGDENIAARLVRALKCDGLLVTNIRDHVLLLSVFKTGATLGSWICPEADEERLEAICEAAFDGVPDGVSVLNPGGMQGLGRALAKLSAAADDEALGILGREYVMAYERHGDLARALGLPDRIILGSYEDIVEGTADKLSDADEPIILGDE